MKKLVALVVLFSSLLGRQSFAGTLDTATILRDFNAVIFGDATTACDIEGAAIVGGNFKGATVYKSPRSAPSATFGALTVYGSTSGNSINMNNGGSAYVAGDRGPTINFNGGGSYLAAAPDTPMASVETALKSLSLTLASLTPTQTFSLDDPNNVVFNAVAGADGVAVLDISADMLAAFKGLSIDLGGADSLIINVSGRSIVDLANDISGATDADKIIWNFYEADRVDLETMIDGTVLAPLAAVISKTPIEGTLVAESWTGGGELHSHGFTGTLPGDDPTPVPAPLALSLLGGGLLALGAVRRNIRRS